MTNPLEDGGGPAFPNAVDLPQFANFAIQRGMSLRDWFAGQAMAGMLASPECGGRNEVIAKSAYNIADAMLAARRAKP